MDVLTTTPFGRRPVTAGLIARAQAKQPGARPGPVDKWQVFRDLCTARADYGVNNRCLSVLNALLSFHPDRELHGDGALVVFPSNRTLSERAHGMPESTLRRHLARLVDAGLIRRHDSPNGKRYVSRDRSGTITRAFGFDLTPLWEQSAAIAQAATETVNRAEHLRQMRENVSLMLRDAEKLAAYLGASQPELFATARRSLRRKLMISELTQLQDVLQTLLDQLAEMVAPSPTEEVSGSDSQNERHHLNSKPDTFEIETHEDAVPDRAPSRIPLPLVLKACPDLLPYAPDPPKHWHQLVGLAETVRHMLGIPSRTWDKAKLSMGPTNAAVTLAAILQRVSNIRSPGAYLTSLTRKAEKGRFSPGPMIMALL